MMDTSRDSSTAKRLRVHRAIKSRRPAKTPSEFYLSFPSPLSIFPARLGSGSPATSVGFLSPSQSSGDQTLIGLDSTLPQPSPPFLSYEIFVSLAGSIFPPAFLSSPFELIASSVGGHFSCFSNERPGDTSAIA